MSVMKNCESLVSSLVFAIERIPSVLCCKSTSKLIFEVTQVRSARSGPRGITPLNDELIENAMENNTIKKAILGQLNNVLRGARYTIFKQFKHHVAEIGHRDAHAAIALNTVGVTIDGLSDVTV